MSTVLVHDLITSEDFNLYAYSDVMVDMRRIDMYAIQSERCRPLMSRSGRRALENIGG